MQSKQTNISCHHHIMHEIQYNEYPVNKTYSLW